MSSVSSFLLRYYRRSLISLLILFSILNGSCDNPVEPIDDIIIPPTCEDTTNYPNLSNWLIPLKEGNFWEYKLESQFNEDSVPLFTSYTTQRILSQFNAFKDCSSYETYIYDRESSSNEHWIYWQDSTGFYSLGGFSKTDTLIGKNLIFKYPANVGDEWQNQNIIYDSQNFSYGDSITIKCISTNKNFITPAGNFKCYVYYRRQKIADDVGGFFDIYDYLVPNFGHIGQEVFYTIEVPGDTVSFIFARALLLNYNLQK
ncbi:MAG: hypothetical protein ACM3O3_10770 [Syntrophothermus sp.]